MLEDINVPERSVIARVPTQKLQQSRLEITILILKSVGCHGSQPQACRPRLYRNSFKLFFPAS